MDVHLSVSGRGSLSAQIYRQLLEAVLDGRLRPGDPLPSSRELAASLDVARSTVTTAYDRLLADGVVTGRVGAGTFISFDATPRKPAREAREGAVRPRRIWASLARVSMAARVPAFDFRVGIPDPQLFPLTEWRRLVNRELRPHTFGSSAYADPSGHPALRAAIARHTGLSRGLRASADDVIVTQGAQQALDLIGRVLIEPGAQVALEEPGYPPVRHLFQSLGARIVPVPVDAEGLQVPAIPKAVKLVYVTPSHQFPLGMPMSVQRRAALLSWAERSDGVIVEDDYDSEFRFGGRPFDSLQALDRSGRVIYVGSFSKVMVPGLRVGFLVTPPSLQAALQTAKQLTDWHGDATTQAALARFIDEGLLARHIRRVGRVYAERRDLITEILQRDFRRSLQLVPSVAGLHLTAWFKSRTITGQVAIKAQAAGVAVNDLGRFFVNPPETTGLVIGFGAIPKETIPKGLQQLAAVFHANGAG